MSASIELLSVPDAAARLGITQDTMLEWIRQGKVRVRRPSRKRIYVAFRNGDPFKPEAKP